MLAYIDCEVNIIHGCPTIPVLSQTIPTEATSIPHPPIAVKSHFRDALGLALRGCEIRGVLRGVIHVA